MTAKATVIILIFLILMTGCGKGEVPLPGASPSYMPSPAAIPQATPTTEPTPQPTVEPTPSPTPEPTAAPELTEPDFASLDAINGTRLEWGVKSNGRNTPSISSQQRDMLEKYKSYFMGDPTKKKISFLFSAGYEAGYAGLVLDTLKKHDVKVIFFLVGDYVEREPDIVKKMLDEGHEIGNHSYRHSYLPEIDSQRLSFEILEYERYFRSLYGKGFKYFMPPSGVYSERVLEAANRMGYTTLFWSLTYLDYDIKNQKGPDYAYNNVMNSIHNGAFIFLHLVSSDNANALDRIITDAKAMGYEIGLPEK